MMRKLTLVFLLFIGFQTVASAQVRDSVTITIPPYTDTTCVGTQLVFSAHQSNDTFTGVSYHWYANSVFTGVVLDTFLTTALNSGDSVYCMLRFTNSFGVADSFRSNVITIYHAPIIPARVLTSLIVGSNPDCAGHPLTFSAYPINGGITPQYQWMINGVELPGEDSTMLTRVFGGSDTIVCRMISNSPCAPVDTVYSIPVPIIHLHLTESINITTVYDSICQGGVDTFHATAFGYGDNASYQWYINNNPITGAIGTTFYTDTLMNGDTVYCVLTSTDSCVLNPVDTSNSISILIRHVFTNTASIDLTVGANPGCLDSTVTFTARYDTFGVAPYYAWYVNGVLTNVGSNTLSGMFANTDVVSFMIQTTDGQCYQHYVYNVPGVVMVRDTTPVAPVVHLHGDTLITYSSGTLTWYHSNTLVPLVGTVIPGATDTFYHPTALGYYYAIANNANCPSIASNVIYISLLGVEEVNKSRVNIYPNPTTGVVSLDWNNTAVSMKLNVYNALGQNVINGTIDHQSHYDVDLSALSSGNYYIQLRDDEGKYNTYKIILQHD